MEERGMTIAGRNVSLAALIAGVGGILALVSSPLVWASGTISGHTDDLAGFDDGMNAGKAAVLLGIVVLVLVAVWLLDVKLPSVAGLSSLALATVAAGVLVVGVAVATYFTNWLGEMSLKDLSDQISAVGGSVSVGIGLLLDVVAGIVVIVGGGLALVRKS
jgi:hypothetical protein